MSLLAKACPKGGTWSDIPGHGWTMIGVLALFIALVVLWIALDPS